MSFADPPREVTALLAALLAGIALPLLVLAARRWLRRARALRRSLRAVEGEREAVALLQDRGFVVEEAQVRASYALDVDGVSSEVGLRADYVVSRGGERFVAEVKTGRAAPSLSTPATRRQLLEYQHAFGVRGVLLVDADAKHVSLVAFRSPVAPAPGAGALWMSALAGALAAGAAVLALARW